MSGSVVDSNKTHSDFSSPEKDYQYTPTTQRIQRNRKPPAYLKENMVLHPVRKLTSGIYIIFIMIV